MTTHSDQTANADPFTQFWSDYFSRVGIGASPAMPQSQAGGPSPEAVKQMQRLFFDALAKYCDDFMRSEQFLSMMKQTMDQSLAFKQQLDQFLTRLYQGSQSPSLTDVTDLGGTLRNIETRIMDRLAALEDKVAAVEDGRGRRKAAADRTAPGRRKTRPPKPSAKRRK